MKTPSKTRVHPPKKMFIHLDPADLIPDLIPDFQSIPTDLGTTDLVYFLSPKGGKWVLREDLLARLTDADPGHEVVQVLSHPAQKGPTRPAFWLLHLQPGGDLAAISVDAPKAP